MSSGLARKRAATDPTLGLSQRQALFVKYWSKRNSPTFSNAYRSALKAGYAESYAVKINQHLGETVQLRLAEELERAGLTKAKLAQRITDVALDNDKDRVPAMRLASQVMGELQTAPQVTVNVFQRLGIDSQEQAEKMLAEYQAATQLTSAQQFDAACRVVDAWCKQHGEERRFPAVDGNWNAQEAAQRGAGSDATGEHDAEVADGEAKGS